MDRHARLPRRAPGRGSRGGRSRVSEARIADSLRSRMRVLVTGRCGIHRLTSRRRARRARRRRRGARRPEHRFRGEHQSGATLVEGSVADEARGGRAVDGCELVFHQAAHKAVLRSVELPLTTDTANTHGTLTILKAAADAGVRRVVHASSSSVYGGATTVPTPESEPLSLVRRTRSRSSRPSTTAGSSPSCTGSRPLRCATSTCTGPASVPTRPTRR